MDIWILYCGHIQYLLQIVYAATNTLIAQEIITSNRFYCVTK